MRLKMVGLEAVVRNEKRSVIAMPSLTVKASLHPSFAEAVGVVLLR